MAPHLTSQAGVSTQMYGCGMIDQPPSCYSPLSREAARLIYSLYFQVDKTLPLVMSSGARF